jgi:hypothetical protein
VLLNNLSAKVSRIRVSRAAGPSPRKNSQG